MLGLEDIDTSDGPEGFDGTSFYNPLCYPSLNEEET